MLTSPVLVLNRYFVPITITSVKRAFVMLYGGIAKAVDTEYNTFDFESWAQISEFRDQTILKEIYFTSYNTADRFIQFLFGDRFYTHENYITEIVYNKSNRPVFYGIKSTRDNYIGHITLNYDENNYLIREVWFQGTRKIREFLK